MTITVHTQNTVEMGTVVAVCNLNKNLRIEQETFGGFGAGRNRAESHETQLS